MSFATENSTFALAFAACRAQQSVVPVRHVRAFVSQSELMVFDSDGARVPVLAGIIRSVLSPLADQPWLSLKMQLHRTSSSNQM